MAAPLLFLDFDDVLCVNAPYGGYDVLAGGHPDDLWQRLFHEPAVRTLLDIIAEHSPRIVITTSWLRFMDRAGLEQVLRSTGLGPAADALHEHCEALQASGATRLDAIEAWLAKHHRGEPWGVLDDAASGTGLRGSVHDRAGRVVLCDVGVGLHAGHRVAVRRALNGGSFS